MLTVGQFHKETSNGLKSAAIFPPPTTSVCLGDRVSGSDVDLFSDLDDVIHLDAEVSNGALDLRMSKQMLRGSEVAGSPVDQHRHRASQ